LHNFNPENVKTSGTVLLLMQLELFVITDFTDHVGNISCSCD